MEEKISAIPDIGKTPLSPADLQRLLGLISTIKYGSVTLVIQDGKVVQIDKNEKMRLK